jgi:hypothetical protein
MRRLVVCVGVLTLALSGCKGGTPTAPAPAPPPAVSVKAGDLMKEYSDNALAADAKYKGKILKVTGKFGTATKVPLKGYAATLLPEDAGDVNLSGVQCFLLESAEADVAKFQPGEMVTIQGTCDGQSLAQVTMSKCSVVK